jgi:hypothetical protein
MRTRTSHSAPISGYSRAANKAAGSPSERVRLPAAAAQRGLRGGIISTNQRSMMLEHLSVSFLHYARVMGTENYMG